jgi:hypothetical protein
MQVLLSALRSNPSAVALRAVRSSLNVRLSREADARSTWNRAVLDLSPVVQKRHFAIRIGHISPGQRDYTQPIIWKLVCSGCGRKLEQAHDAGEREVRDLPCMEFRITVVVEIYRVCCPDCGVKIEKKAVRR